MPDINNKTKKNAANTISPTFEDVILVERFVVNMTIKTTNRNSQHPAHKSIEKTVLTILRFVFERELSSEIIFFLTYRIMAMFVMKVPNIVCSIMNTKTDRVTKLVAHPFVFKPA